MPRNPPISAPWKSNNNEHCSSTMIPLGKRAIGYSGCRSWLCANGEAAITNSDHPFQPFAPTASFAHSLTLALAHCIYYTPFHLTSHHRLNRNEPNDQPIHHSPAAHNPTRRQGYGHTLQVAYPTVRIRFYLSHFPPVLYRFLLFRRGLESAS